MEARLLRWACSPLRAKLLPPFDSVSGEGQLTTLDGDIGVNPFGDSWAVRESDSSAVGSTAYQKARRFAVACLTHSPAS